MDTLTPAQRSERMSRVKGKNTKPELIMRRLVHSLGYRFRLHGAKLPGRPDLVFAGRKAVIFVHGCFFHRHPDPACRLARLPKSRLDFWLPKLDANRARDERNVRELLGTGWRVLTVWECELRDKMPLIRRITDFLGPPAGSVSAHGRSQRKIENTKRASRGRVVRRSRRPRNGRDARGL
jgi:DNA mismatch endonuclease (patch repair protein)